MSRTNDQANQTQIIQPWQHGHGETKATCLWLKESPKAGTFQRGSLDARQEFTYMPPSKDQMETDDPKLTQWHRQSNG
jgi:hypothetical protein